MNKLKIVVLFLGLGSLVQAQTLQDAVKKTQNERYDLARKDYIALTKADPTNVENHFSFGNFYQTIGETDSAIGMWKKAASLNAEDKLAQLSGVKAIYFSGDTATASQSFCAFLGVKKQRTPQAYFVISETYFTGKKQNLKLAEKYARELVKLDAKNIDAYILLGDILLTQTTSNASSATQEYNNALAINPSSARVIVRKAKIYQAVQNYQLANDEYKKAQTVEPNYAPAYRENAELNILFEKYQAAIELWKKYLALNDSQDARYRYVTSLFGAKQYCEVLPEIEDLKNKGFSNLYTLRFQYYSRYECNPSEDSLIYVKALKESDEFFASCPKDKLIAFDYKYRSLIYQKLGNNDAAVKELEKAAIEDTSKAADYYGEMASIYSKTKNYDKLIEVYLKKESAYPTKMTTNDYYELGRAYFFSTKPNYVAADSAFTKLTRMTPEWTGGHFWKARSEVRLDTDPKNKTYLAKNSYEKMLSLMTDEEIASGSYNGLILEACKYLGDYYVNSPAKNKEKAIEIWTRVRSLDPNDAQAKAFFNSSLSK